jgi:hypothetical protein
VGTVNQGADADTTGAICGMLAGAYYGLEAIPKRWLKKMDPKLLRELEEHADRLIMASPAGRFFKQLFSQLCHTDPAGHGLAPHQFKRSILTDAVVSISSPFAFSITFRSARRCSDIRSFVRSSSSCST